MNYEIHKINEIHGGESYLILSGDDAVLVDCGYAIGVDGSIRNIEKHLGGRQLRHIILSHSHYDHIMGSPAISEHFPRAKIFAHPVVREIFGKASARSIMENMSEAAARDRNLPFVRGWADKLHVDVDVHEDDVILVGDMKIRVLETPGHTRCSISLYFENEDLLFAAETLGVTLDFPRVVPGFIVSYDDAVKSIEKIIRLHPRSILLPHSSVVAGDDVITYLSNSLNEAKLTYKTVIESNKKDYSISEIVEQLKSIYYVGDFRKFQPDDAFYANWTALVTKIITK